MGNVLVEEKVVLSKFLSIGIGEDKVNHLVDTLYNRFDSLYNIINAPDEELLKVNGLGVKKIGILRTIPNMLEYYVLSGMKELAAPFKMKDLVNYFIITLSNLKFEVFVLACLDIKKHFIGVEQIFRGSINTATIYPRDLVEKALTLGASYVIFAHNHPSGIARPSKEDIEITRTLFQAFYVVHVHIVDHVIIGGNKIYSFRDNGILDKYKEDIKNNMEDNVC